MLSSDDVQRLLLINVEEAEQPLKGKVRTVRLEKTDYHLGQSVGSVTVVTDHDTSGRVTERRVYRPDGTLSFYESFRSPIVDLNQSSGPPFDLDIVTGPDGTVVSYRDSDGRALEVPVRRRTVVQSMDSEGNWTKKTTVECDPVSGEDVMIASMDRTITYYE
jgi:hypothetical protein